MDCKKAETFLVEYLYQELSASKTVEVEAHLKTCDGCSKLLLHWKEIHEGFQQTTGTPAAPPFLKQRILNSARKELERKPTFSERAVLWLKPALIIPAVFVAVLVLFLYPMNKKMAGVPTDKAIPQKAPAPPAMAEELHRDSFVKMKTKAEADEIQGGRKGDLATETPYPSDKPEPSTTVPSLAKDSESGYQEGYAAENRQMQAKLQQNAQEEEAKKVAKENNAPAGGMVAPSAPVMAQPQATEPPPAEVSPSSSMDDQKNEYAASPAPQQMAEQQLKANEKPAEKTGNANDANYNYDQAQSNMRQDRIMTAQKFAKQAVDLDTNKELAARFYNDGVIYQKNKEFTKAIAQYKAITNNYPSYDALNDVLFRLGECYAAIGKIDDAQMIFRQLLKSNPNSTVLREKLANVEKQRKETEELRSLGYVQK